MSFCVFFVSFVSFLCLFVSFLYIFVGLGVFLCLYVSFFWTLLVVHFKNSTVKLRGVLHLKVVETDEFLLNNTCPTSNVNEVFLHIHTLNFPVKLENSKAATVSRRENREGTGRGHFSVSHEFLISFTCHSL